MIKFRAIKTQNLAHFFVDVQWLLHANRTETRNFMLSMGMCDALFSTVLQCDYEFLLLFVPWDCHQRHNIRWACLINEPNNSVHLIAWNGSMSINRCVEWWCNHHQTVYIYRIIFLAKNLFLFCIYTPDHT